MREVFYALFLVLWPISLRAALAFVRLISHTSQTEAAVPTNNTSVIIG